MSAETEYGEYPWRDGELLRELYHDRGMTQGEIADELGCSTATVCNWMGKLSIQEDYTDRGLPCGEAELREMYHEKGMTQSEIAEVFDCSPNTVSEWMSELGIGTDYEYVAELRDGEWLRGQYVDRGKSGGEIAEDLGCSKRTVFLWLRKHDIGVREPTWERPAYFRTDHHGYERWDVTISGDTYLQSVHRLLAVAEYGVGAVKGMDVHHKNGVKWDNRHDNIELCTRSEHRRKHVTHREKDENGRWT